MPVDPIKPNLKPPGTKRLKLNCHMPLSDHAFKFKLRRYTVGFVRFQWQRVDTVEQADGQRLTLVHFSAQRKHLLRDTPHGFRGSTTKLVSI